MPKEPPGDTNRICDWIRKDTFRQVCADLIGFGITRLRGSDGRKLRPWRLPLRPRRSV